MTIANPAQAPAAAAKPIDMNYGMVTAAASWVRENLSKSDPYLVKPMDKTTGLIMIEGNTAAFERTVIVEFILISVVLTATAIMTMFYSPDAGPGAA